MDHKPESYPAYGHRLGDLRAILGLTQVQLAQRLEVSQSFLSQVQRGERPAPEALIVRASQEFNVPIRFFEVVPNRDGFATFRKLSRASARSEDRIVRLFDEAARVFREVSERSGYRESRLPGPDDLAEDPEVAARQLRELAGFDDTEPVLNVTRALERLGVGVVSHLDDEGETGHHTGISRPSEGNSRPLVAVVSGVPGAVARMTLLHESSHLIFDRRLARQITSTRSAEERRAFKFASAFLLPPQVVRSRVSEHLNLQSYLPVKADYGISVRAVIQRAHDLGVITPQRYKSLQIQYSSRHWREHEPVPVADERPTLLSQALRRVYGAQTIARASHDLGAAPEWLNRWAQWTEPAAPQQAGGQVINLTDFRRRR